MTWFERITDFLAREGALSGAMIDALNKKVHEAVDQAIKIDGVLVESQRGWAEEYYKRDPGAFKEYVRCCRSIPALSKFFRKPYPQNSPEYICQLERENEKLRAENAGQQGTILALNGMILILQERLAAA